MALVKKTLAELVTISRASGGGRFNSAGQFEWLSSSNSPRFDYDPVTLLPRGILIEEQRTNLYPRSEDLPNQGQSGAGAALTVTNSDASVGHWTTVNRTVADGNGRYINMTSVTVTAGATFSVSAHIKKAASGFFSCRFQWSYPDRVDSTINLNTGATTSNKYGATASITSTFTVVDRGTYWEMALVVSHATATIVQFHMAPHATAIATDGVPSGTSSFEIRMLQVEQGAFPTSYIPTTSAQVTRAGDQPTLNSLAPWFNADAMTLVVEWVTTSHANNPSAAAFTIGAGNSGFSVTSGGTSRWWNGTTNVTATTAAVGAVRKEAAAITPTGRALCLNGGAVAEDASPGLGGTPSTLRLGSSANNLQYANGWIRRVRVYPRRETNAKLQELTA